MSPVADWRFKSCQRTRDRQAHACLISPALPPPWRRPTRASVTDQPEWIFPTGFAEDPSPHAVHCGWPELCSTASPPRLISTCEKKSLICSGEVAEGHLAVSAVAIVTPWKLKQT